MCNWEHIQWNPLSLITLFIFCLLCVIILLFHICLNNNDVAFTELYGCKVDCLLTIAGHIAWMIIKGPLEAVIGILYGIIFGVILWYLPHSKHVSLVVLFSVSSVLIFICCICFCLSVQCCALSAVHGIGQII